MKITFDNKRKEFDIDSDHLILKIEDHHIEKIYIEKDYGKGQYPGLLKLKSEYMDLLDGICYQCFGLYVLYRMDRSGGFTMIPSCNFSKMKLLSKNKNPPVSRVTNFYSMRYYIKINKNDESVKTLLKLAWN